MEVYEKTIERHYRKFIGEMDQNVEQVMANKE
jgi:hypothetical protein